MNNPKFCSNCKFLEICRKSNPVINENPKYGYCYKWESSELEFINLFEVLNEN